MKVALPRGDFEGQKRNLLSSIAKFQHARKVALGGG